MLSLLL